MVKHSSTLYKNIIKGDRFLKIALVHDWLVTDAGAEKVLKAILDLYPEADVFSLVDFLNDTDRKKILNGKHTKSSFIQKLPFARTQFRVYLPFFSKAIESFDLRDYDLIISSSWAVAKGVKTHNGQCHISYCHTPVRYAWDLYDEYVTSLSFFKKLVVQWTLNRLRKWDIISLNRVNYFVANSKFVQERIERIYDRKSKVIYPPVDVNKFTLYEKKNNFYMTASRLVPYKKTKLIVEAFNAMPEKQLIVIGYGEEYEDIKSIAKSNITLMGYQSEDVLIRTMQKAKAFVYAAVEDFGIAPMEAMACGTPVIALDRGGTGETIVQGFNGIHFKDQSVEAIIESILQFEKQTFSAYEISNYAKLFSKERFQEEIRSYVRECQVHSIIPYEKN
jgi:glycosyltransferase involved in cell wall biosynthesis